MTRAVLDTDPAKLARIGRLDPADALMQVASLRAALPSCAVPERLDAIAAALPDRVAELAPELALELASLAAALVSHAPGLPLDIDALEPVVRTAWLRVGLSSRDARVSGQTLASLDDTWLLHVIHDWSLSAAADPAAVFERMCRAEDARLRAAVVPRLAAAVADLAITPEQGFACVVALASTASGAARRDAYAALLADWSQQLSSANADERGRLIRAGLGLGLGARDARDDLELVRTCVELAASLGLRGPLRDLFDHASEGDDARLVEALVGLGSVATREDLELALNLAVADPLRFGPPARTLVLDAHRHGVFIDDVLIPSALEAFDLHHGWTAEELVRVTHVARAALLDELGRHRAHDPRWLRRAGILAASVGTGAHELLAELLVELAADDHGDLHVAAALLEAAGASPEYDAEAPLLAWLDRLPARVIPVLRVKGGAEAGARLQALLEDPRCPELLRESALAAVWALSSGRPALLRELSAALGPRRSGLLNTRLRAARDDLAATIYAEAAWPSDPEHEVDPSEALELLCESGELRHLAEITRLFRIVYAHVVQLALDGDFSIKRGSLPTLEQQIYRYGRHLIAGGRAVRRWTEPTPETGRDLVLAVATDWLRERPEPPVCVALLETIARQQPRGPWLRVIEPFWRHPDPNVQRAAIEAILSGDDGEEQGGAPGLELSLCRLTASKDARLVRQALGAVARFEARWAEPMVIASLRGASMLITQAAAEALVVVGSRRCVPALVDGLAHHENERLRELLLEALWAVAGYSRAAILLDALVAEGPPRPHDRRQRLLRAAISGNLTLAAALRLAESSNPVHAVVVEAALDGTLALADGSSQVLAEALYRAKLRPAPSKVDPTRRLRLEGFSPDAARELIDVRADVPTAELERVLACVRAGLADWLAWLGPNQIDGDNRDSAAGAMLVLEAATAQDAQHLDALLELALALSNQSDGTKAPTVAQLITNFIARCVAPVSASPGQRMRALTLLRRLPPAAEVRGDHRHDLLGRLGAIRTRADLDACLAACRIGPDVVGDSTRLLDKALAMPSKRDDEDEALEQLRREIDAWHRSPAAEASAWLSGILRVRPLGLAVMPEPPRARRTSSDLPPSQARLDALLTALTDDDLALRTRAAERLLAWPDARASWGAVLEGYLAGSFELQPRALTVLANNLDAWPDMRDPARPGAIAWSKQACALARQLDAIQQQRLLPVWVDAWSRGLLEFEPLITSVDQSLLIPLARARALAGEFGLVRLLRRDGSLALATLVRELAERSPNEVAHLLAAHTEGDPIKPDGEGSLSDPIRAMNLDQLVATIAEPHVDVGLAVRAVHALASHGERAADALEQLSVDRRARIRSAALRALRKVAPRERCLATAARVLAIETRREVIPGLMKTLANGRYEPGAAAVLAYTTHRDTKLRDAAMDALSMWGREIVPTLRRASRRARPDHRRTYEGLIAWLEEDAE